MPDTPPADCRPRDRRFADRAERMVILGNLGAQSFLPWIRRHAGRLGLEQSLVSAAEGQIVLDLAGTARADPMRWKWVACSGPIDVFVDDISRGDIKAGDVMIGGAQASA